MNSENNNNIKDEMQTKEKNAELMHFSSSFIMISNNLKLFVCTVSHQFSEESTLILDKDEVATIK